MRSGRLEDSERDQKPLEGLEQRIMIRATFKQSLWLLS